MKAFKIGLLLTLLSSLLFPTVSVVAADKLQLTLWHMEARPTRVKAIEDVVNTFNQQSQDVQIKVEVQSWGDVYVKAIAAVQSGKYPDFIFTTPDFQMNLMATRVVRPIDDVMTDLQKKYKIYSPALDPFTFDNHFWAAPLYGMSEVLWYRTDLFEKAGLDPKNPPKTWDQLLAACKQLMDKGVVKHPMAVPGDWHLATIQQIYPLMVTNKAEHIFDPKGDIIFDNPRTVQAYEFYKKLFDMSPPGSATWQWDQPIAAFVGGEVAMVIEKGQYIEQWDLRSKLDPNLMAATPVPIPDTDGQQGTAYFSNGIHLLKTDPKVRAAFRRFVEYLYEPNNMARLLTAAPGLFLPVTVEASTSSVLLENPTIARHKAKFNLMIEQSKNGKLYGFTRRPYQPNIGRIMGQNLIAWTAQRMIFDGASAEKAVQLGAAKMKEAIE